MDTVNQTAASILSLCLSPCYLLKKSPDCMLLSLYTYKRSQKDLDIPERLAKSDHKAKT